MRDRHNYETRRMLGIVEPCLNEATLGEELRLLGEAAGLMGVLPCPPVVESDRGQTGEVGRALSLLSGFSGRLTREGL